VRRDLCSSCIYPPDVHTWGAQDRPDVRTRDAARRRLSDVELRVLEALADVKVIWGHTRLSDRGALPVGSGG
jgi:hypothetical protein